MSDSQLNIIRYASLVAVVVVVMLGWFDVYGQNLTGLSAFQLFPLFGLIAFSVMTTHFMLYAYSLSAKTIPSVNKTYSRISGSIVLFCLLAHPGLLIWQLWRDGFGLPPQSYTAFVAESALFAVYFGTIALVGFLLYEVASHNKKIRAYWSWIIGIQIAAMILALIHANNLGILTERGWFMYFWVVQTIALLISFVVIIFNYAKINRVKETSQS